MAKKTKKIFKLSTNSRKNISGVRRGILVLINRTLKKSKHDFGIPKSGGKRSPQEQNNLFHQRPKVTQLDGFKNKSYHQSGNAFDIFIYDEHGACWDCKEKYEEVKELFMKEFDLMKKEELFGEDENLYWGGDWRFKDLPHFEIR